MVVTHKMASLRPVSEGLEWALHSYKPTVVYPKRTSKELYINIVQQCESLGIEVSKHELQGIH